MNESMTGTWSTYVHVHVYVPRLHSVGEVNSLGYCVLVEPNPINAMSIQFLCV